MAKNFFKNERERLLWIRLNAERIQYAERILHHRELELGEIGEPFTCMQISENQLEYDENTYNAPRYSLEELVLPHDELFKISERRSKQKLTEMFGTELGNIANELL